MQRMAISNEEFNAAGEKSVEAFSQKKEKTSGGWEFRQKDVLDSVSQNGKRGEAWGGRGTILGGRGRSKKSSFRKWDFQKRSDGK